MVVAGTGKLDLAHVVAARDPSGRLQALFTLRLPQAPAKLTGLPFLCGPSPAVPQPVCTMSSDARDIFHVSA